MNIDEHCSLLRHATSATQPGHVQGKQGSWRSVPVPAIRFMIHGMEFA